MIQLLGFDADDTLWHNEHVYHEARARFQEICARFVTPEAAGAHLDQIEIGNVPLYGYGIKSYVLSMLEAAIDLAGDQFCGDELQQILKLARGMLSSPIQLIEGVTEVLEQVKGRYPLMLLTKGDPSEQERKIERSGLANYFQFIEVIGDKTVATYQSLLGKINVDPRQFVMVGNSLRSDILPVTRLGGRAVLIPYATEWAHEAVSAEERASASFAEIASIRQLPALLDRLDQGV